MNSLRLTLSELYQAPVQSMSWVAYFQYLNSVGKITARSQMDLSVILLTHLEELQKKNEQYEDNFKEIQEILTKLVEKNKSKDDIVHELQEALKVFPKLPPTPETVPNPYPPNTVAANYDPRPTVPATGKMYSCKFCPESFPDPLALGRHSKIHKK